MAKPAHTRVTFEGVVGSVPAPIERWAFGINFPHDVFPPEGDHALDDLAAGEIKNQYSAFLATQMPSDTILTQVKVARVGADGHVERSADGSYHQGLWIGSVPGAGSPMAMPLQTALCVSLKTSRAGATGKGRFFLPWTSYPIQATDKRLTSADTAALAGHVRDFLNGLATVTTFPPQVVSSKGYMSEVTGIRIGRVPDTMRSRREDSPEAYVDLPLA